MKQYSSFLVRCWLIEDSQQGERVVIGVEHIQTGGHRRVASLPEAEEWMLGLCRAAASASGKSEEKEAARTPRRPDDDNDESRERRSEA